MMLLLIALLLFAEDPSPGFTVLDWPDDQLRQRPDQCPVRVEIPLPDMFTRRSFRKTIYKTQAVKCGGSYIDKLRIRVEQGKWNPRERAIQGVSGYDVYLLADVYLSAGLDRIVSTRYWVLVGGVAVAEGAEEFVADEAAVNWEDGVHLFVPKKAAAMVGPTTLRVEFTVGERAP